MEGLSGKFLYGRLGGAGTRTVNNRPDPLPKTTSDTSSTTKRHPIINRLFKTRDPSAVSRGRVEFQRSSPATAMPRLPTSPTSFDRPKNMFSTFFSNSKSTCSKPSAPGIVEGEEDCLHDESLASPALTAIWRSTCSKLDANEKTLLEALHAAYLSRTEALRTYQATVFTLTDQLTDLRTSNSALKKQLDITSQAHASLLSEITGPNRRPSISEDGTMTPQSEGDDSGWWSDSGIGAEEDDTLTFARSTSSSSSVGGRMRRGSSSGNWLRRRSDSPSEPGETKLLRKENLRLREEIERLEGVLEDCSMVLGGLDGR